MVPFSASSVSAKAPPPQAEMDSIKAELQRMKDVTRLRQKWGAGLTDAAADGLLEEERAKAIAGTKKKELDEANRLQEIAWDQAYRALACQLVQGEKMIISLDGARLSNLTPDLIIPCPRCGKNLGGLSHAVYEVAKLWYWNREQDPINQFIVYNARNPLGIFIGVMAHDARNCPNCKQNTGGFLQLVMV